MANASAWEGDLVRESALAGRLVIFEEAPRDGAQGKTLMNAEERLRIANLNGAAFGEDGPRHVLFTAGFPSAAKEEFEITRRVAHEAENVSTTCVCRGTRSDIDTAIAAMRGGLHPRLMYFVPGSEASAQAILHKSAPYAVDVAVEMAKYAVDKADGVAIDMAFMNAHTMDRELLIDAVSRLTDAGVATVQLADTIGGRLPSEIYDLYTEVMARAEPDAIVMAHLHNDLGLALANTLEAIRAGVRVVASSWLGLGERSGMTCTEQLMLILNYDSERLPVLIGDSGPLWWTEPDLTCIPEIARIVSAATDVPLKVTDPVVGTGVGSISTGTPFIAPNVFQPYDPQKLLGIDTQVFLTQLASDRVVKSVASKLGFSLTDEQAHIATRWVKTQAYRQNKSVVPEEAFRAFIEGIGAASVS